MKSFWGETYDGEKDRRYGMLFFKTLLLFLGTVALGAAGYGIFGTSEVQECALAVLPVTVIILMVLTWRAIRLARHNRNLRLKYGSLSRDELLKARSKLRNGWKPVRPPARRVPDTDLKY